MIAAGEEQESGEAIPGKGKAHWHYTTIHNNPSLKATRILITTIDHPGNVTEYEQLL